jgi:hypothetical protein
MELMRCWDPTVAYKSATCVYTQNIEGKCVSIHDEISSIAFPNPSGGHYKIKFDGLPSGSYSVDLMKYSGEVIEQYRVHSEEISTFEIDISGREDGLYFLRIVGSDDYVNTYKLIKN